MFDQLRYYGLSYMFFPRYRDERGRRSPSPRRPLTAREAQRRKAANRQAKASRRANRGR